jgi:hypothetical protein
MKPTIYLPSELAWLLLPPTLPADVVVLFDPEASPIEDRFGPVEWTASEWSKQEDPDESCCAGCS